MSLKWLLKLGKGCCSPPRITLLISESERNSEGMNKRARNSAAIFRTFIVRVYEVFGRTCKYFMKLSSFLQFISISIQKAVNNHILSKFPCAMNYRSITTCKYRAIISST